MAQTVDHCALGNVQVIFLATLLPLKLFYNRVIRGTIGDSRSLQWRSAWRRRSPPEQAKQYYCSWLQLAGSPGQSHPAAAGATILTDVAWEVVVVLASALPSNQARAPRLMSSGTAMRHEECCASCGRCPSGSAHSFIRRWCRWVSDWCWCCVGSIVDEVLCEKKLICLSDRQSCTVILVLHLFSWNELAYLYSEQSSIPSSSVVRVVEQFSFWSYRPTVIRKLLEKLFCKCWECKAATSSLGQTYPCLNARSRIIVYTSTLPNIVTAFREAFSWVGGIRYRSVDTDSIVFFFFTAKSGNQLGASTE